MLTWAIRFFLAALAAGLVAASDIASEVAILAKIVVAVMLALASVSLIAAWRRSSRDPDPTSRA